MRLSIWQQFSSNHSANFRVVGKFQTEEDAHAAADKLNQIMESINVWWQENKSDDWKQKVYSEQLTPPEQQFRGLYGVDWPKSVVADYSIWNRALPIHTVKQYVFVESGEVLFGPQPFNQLMERLGGEVSISLMESIGLPERYPETTLVADLTFTVPDEATLQEVDEQWPDFQALIGVSHSTYYVLESFGMRCRVSGLYFFDYTDSVAAIFTWLENLGCTEIDFTFVQDPPPDSKDKQ